MKQHPSKPSGPARHLAAALFLSALPAAGQTIVNPSFETDTFATFPGTASVNGGAITGWATTQPTLVGLNPSNGVSVYANNGVVPDGAQVAFIKGGIDGAGNLSTTITGLTVGTKYKVTMRVNARAGDTPTVAFSSDGTGPTVALRVASVEGAATNTIPYRTVAFEFTATAASHTITLTNNRTDGTHYALVDDVKIAPSDNAWSFAPWTGDADSGIDPQYIYTHAYVFGRNAPVTINGVDFIGREAGVPGRFTLGGLTSVYGNGAVNLTGESANLARDFRYAGDPAITVGNLKPNTAYVFTVYGYGFDAVDKRSSTFSTSVPGSQKLSVNLNQYGQGNGIIVTYRYTTDAAGTPVKISYPSDGGNYTYHTGGFSNREATPATQPELWTVEPWMDDATSGVDPTYTYTHAFSFGSAEGFNLNGIDFTGILGIDPSGAGFATSGLPAQYQGDFNSITGDGATMARNFVYNGFPSTVNLTGLTPGKDYVFTAYSVGWDDGTRELSFIGGTGEQGTVLDQNIYGPNNGMRFEYRYTAAASGKAKITVSSFDGVKSIHCYGMSNREADPSVGIIPEITRQPVGKSIGIGEPLVLRVAAKGSGPLTYLWKRDNVELVGETGATLDLGEAEISETGSYTVEVSNGSGSDVSDAVAVTVLDNVPGVFGTGLGVDGFPLAGGAIEPHFKLITNPDAPGSTVAYVQTNIPGAWLANSDASKWIGPRSDTAGAGALGMDAGEGPGNYVYRTKIDLTGFNLSMAKIQGSWASDNVGSEIRVNGVAVPGTANTNQFATLTPFSIGVDNAPGLIAGVNTLDFVLNNSDAVTGFTGLRVEGLTAIGELPANSPPHIALQPVGGNGPHYGSFMLTVGASGTAPLSYQWYKDDVAIDGETESLLTLYIDDITPAGSYKVVVSNGISPDAVSNAVAVTVNNANPVALGGAFVTNKNKPLEIDPLAYATDADLDPLELNSFAATSFNGGTITEEFGILTYTPTPGFFGEDGFTYSVKDEWGGVSTSAIVSITVNDVSEPPGQLALVVDLTGGTVNGTFTGTEGVSYTLQRSTTLAGDWENIDTAVAPASGMVEVEDANPPAGRAFYRIAYPD